MEDRLRMEIVGRLAPLLAQVARRQGRGPDEVMEDALERYLRWLGLDAELGSGIGKAIDEIHVEPPERTAPLLGDDFQDLLDRMFSRFDLDEDEAERIAVEEQHAWRRERRERKAREGTGR